ncbi:ATPase [Arthrobacter sp. SDTb3-6]|uniref:ATPase n=1 Tax=Arthrobacter sp. SDTb3-6 TaxID=2713571 RepID=UPI00159E1D41|nr:ATPase [Arthrobacter sp. SDTb3-6]NVM99479.1 ATPase [Arthrobacter sp. SDTb3-6]
METSTDRIEREISIAASAEKVWELIRRPGWWINDGEVVDHAFDPDSDVNVIIHPVHGTFRIRTVALEAPRYAAFRWLGDDDAAPTTLVEFWIDGDDSGVTLRVAESGFDSLGVSEEERRRKFEGNAEGWQIELDAALKWAQRA